MIFKARADKELLSGSLNVYFADRYIGKTYLSEKKAGEEFNMSLGADRNLKVKREKIKETFLGKIERDTVVRELAYKITAENIKDKSVILRVIDSIPVSRTDKVQVKNIRITPEPGQRNYQDQEGVMLWEYNLQPREKQEINIEFVVTYPKDLFVNGL